MRHMVHSRESRKRMFTAVIVHFRWVCPKSVTALSSRFLIFRI